jgi:hypothetical protein
MRALADTRREARARRGGLRAKEAIFERWLNNPLLDVVKLIAEFPDVKPNTIYAWLNSWLNGTSSPGYPASGKGRMAEISSAQNKARKSGIISYRSRVSPSTKQFSQSNDSDQSKPAHGSGVSYFFYNTDARALSDEPRPRFHHLFNLAVAVAGGDRRYGERFDQLQPADVLLMYENGIGVVGLGAVMERWDGISHKTAVYYTANEMNNLDGGANEYRIQVEWFADLSNTPITVDETRKLFGNTPRGVVRRIVEKRSEVAVLVEKLQGQPFIPEEISQPRLYVEGAIRQVSVNAYERNRDAVRKCKQYHGACCIICKFDFGSVYGPEFDGFIHVHHLRPLSEIGREYIIDPKKDLKPVCPNCHAVIHHGGKLRDIDEVRRLINK